MTQVNRIILSGGGTGGHIYPALSICKRLKELNPQLECLYIGTQRGLESTLVPGHGLDFASIQIQGIKRSLSLDNLKSLYLMLTSTSKAKKLIQEFKPEVVVGTGGYVCAPVVYAAAKLGIPTLIHEQNSVAGLTNKFLAAKVCRIATCFEAVHKDFSKHQDKIRLTGNPRAQEVAEIVKDPRLITRQFDLDSSLPTVLIFGGSRGAPAINKAALEAIPLWQEVDYQVIIATGKDHYQEISSSLNLEDLPQNIKILPYIDNMPQVFKAIDIVVCRSGATTLTELMALGKPSVLIPSPYVTNNHQEYNAKALVDKGAALMIKQSDLNGKELFDQLNDLLFNQDKLEDMSKQARKMAVIDATDQIINELNHLIH